MKHFIGMMLEGLSVVFLFFLLLALVKIMAAAA